MVKFAPDTIFRETQNYFPFSCVDLFVVKDGKFIATKRAIEPDKGNWHLPGGIIHKGETIEEVVHKVAQEELGIKITVEKYLGVYEDIREKRHAIVHCYIVRYVSGDMTTNSSATEFGFFSEIPDKIPSYQIQEIKDALSSIQK